MSRPLSLPFGVALEIVVAVSFFVVVVVGISVTDVVNISTSTMLGVKSGPTALKVHPKFWSERRHISCYGFRTVRFKMITIPSTNS